MRPLAVVVPQRSDGDRLDRVLAELAPGVSRAEVARWIEAGRVTVDGVPKTKTSERVHAGAHISALPLPPPPSDAVPDASVIVDVVHRDEHIVVVDKPAGMVVHPSKGHAGGTLVNGLLALFSPEGIAPAASRRGSPDGNDDDDEEDASAMQRPGIVHRIDRGTSGLLVVARTVAAREALKSMFAKHDLERVYDAVALGPVASVGDTVTYDTRYGRHPTDRKAFTSKPRGEGKRAVTHVTVMERLDAIGVARVECRLETGRTHQIRVHLADHGAPLLGDPAYGRKPRDPEVRAIGEALGRQALHARVLGFAHPITGEPMRFESPWPADFLRAITELRAIERRRATVADRRHRS